MYLFGIFVFKVYLLRQNIDMLLMYRLFLLNLYFNILGRV